MAKGAGMLAPELATMLVVLTTDAVVDPATLDAALRAATRTTFDRLDSDGCMSTNDTVMLMARVHPGCPPDADEFTDALTQVCADLASQLLADAEGSDHEIAITRHQRAQTRTTRSRSARTVARSNLFKAAIFGKDPNWGRVLAAVGTIRRGRRLRPRTPRRGDERGLGLPGSRRRRAPRPRRPASAARSRRRRPQAGDARRTVWTNDLTHAYVHENCAYST